mmetsp:Transcript_1151/g.3323  ORF Transcript_1151/g.3323 Transcript_1151/m.3323 type:complete len:128 (-) Transcript_1151:84-467(-)
MAAHQHMESRCAATCGGLQQLEVLFNGCRNECSKKCVIDNHELEILRRPVLETEYFAAGAFCPAGRVSARARPSPADLCTPRVRGQVFGEPPPMACSMNSSSGLDSYSDRSHYSLPGVRRLGSLSLG